MIPVWSDGFRAVECRDCNVVGSDGVLASNHRHGGRLLCGVYSLRNVEAGLEIRLRGVVRIVVLVKRTT